MDRGVIDDELAGVAIQVGPAQLRLAPAEPGGAAEHGYLLQGLEVAPDEGAGADHSALGLGAGEIDVVQLCVHDLPGNDEGVGIGEEVEEGGYGALRRDAE